MVICQGQNPCSAGIYGSIKYYLKRRLEMFMKKSSWLDITEYTLLAGSGLGAIAAVALNQLVLTATPVSLLLIVSLINRRRFDHEIEMQSRENLTLVEQRLSSQMENLERRVQGLPTFWDLANLRKVVLQKSRVAHGKLREDLDGRLRALEAQDMIKLKQQIGTLKIQYTRLAESLEQAHTQLNRSVHTEQMRAQADEILQLQSDLGKLQHACDRFARTINPSALKTLQSQVEHLNRRFITLPNPVDTARLQQEMKEVLKVINDMASRRELHRMLEEVEQVRAQQERLDASVAPLRLSTKIMRQQVATLMGVLQGNALFSENGETALQVGSIAEVKQAIAQLEQKVQHLPAEADLVNLRSEFTNLMANSGEQLQAQVHEVQQSQQNMLQQQQMMEGWIKRLPEFLDFSSLRNQMKYLSDRLDGYEVQLEGLGQHLDGLQPDVNRPQYDLLFDLPGAVGENSSRSLLEMALDTAQSQVTMVFPHPDRSVFDEIMLQKIRVFLDRGGKLDLGWGYLSHFEHSPAPNYIHQRSVANDGEKTFIKKVLTQLKDLRRRYPEQFRFKVLGTDDSFMVRDQHEAILGSQVALQSQAFPKLAVGLKTNNVMVIERLLERFEQPLLNEDDEQAYFKRALTRSEMDEKEGAIADYTRVIQVNPKHDVAYNNRGLLRYELGNREGAIADFNRALLINPNSGISYCNRGVVRSELGNLMGAVEDFSDAIHVAADCAPAYFQRGQVRTQMGNKMGAVEDFSDVIRLDENDAAAFYYRGMARNKLGDRIGAIRDLKESARLFALQENASGHQQALASIGQLQKTLVIEGSGEGAMAVKTS
jgi:tetratricopeptide (TPR) repeat protein